MDRFESSGMVARSACVTDARGAEAALTQAGLDRLRAASRTHLDGVERYFIAPVTDGDREALERAANGILDGLGRSAAMDASCAVEP